VDVVDVVEVVELVDDVELDVVGVVAVEAEVVDPGGTASVVELVAAVSLEPLSQPATAIPRAAIRARRVIRMRIVEECPAGRSSTRCHLDYGPENRRRSQSVSAPGVGSGTQASPNFAIGGGDGTIPASTSP
jgi:hypothetical protein